MSAVPPDPTAAAAVTPATIDAAAVTPATIDAAAVTPALLAAPGRRDLLVTLAPQDLPLPLVVSVARAAGPTVLVVGGTHGDELEGQLAVRALATQLPQAQRAGRLLLVPRHNPAACAAGQRTNPADGIDLNRIYGDRGRAGAAEARVASATHRVAAFVQARLLPLADWVIDLHSGGRDAVFVPSVNIQATPGSAQDRALRPAMAAFAAPYSLVFDQVGDDSMPHGGTVEAAARARGIPAVSSELGGGGRTDAGIMAIAQRGLAGVLGLLGVVEAPRAAAPQPASIGLRLDHRDHTLACPQAGQLELLVALGDVLDPGAAVARLYPHDVWAAPVSLTTRRGGIVAALGTLGTVAAGALVAIIAEPLDLTG